MVDYPAPKQFAWWVPPYERDDFHRGGKQIKNTEQMQAAVKHHWDHACYESVYCFDEWKDGRPVKESALLKTIFFDFDDDDNPQNAIDDAAKLACEHTTQWFSGKKGVGMLLHLAPVDIHPSMKAQVIKRAVEGLIEQFGITTADTAVIGDLNRVHRIMNTRHQTTKLYAIPLAPIELRHCPIDEIRKIAESKRHLVIKPTQSRIHADYLYIVERDIIKGRMEELIRRHMLSTKFYSDHKEIRSIEGGYALVETLDRLETEVARIEAKNAPRVETENKWLADAEEELLTYGQLTNGRDRGKEHQARVHFCKYAHENGWTFRQICGAFVNLVDRHGKRCYNKKMTEEQVRSCIR